MKSQHRFSILGLLAVAVALVGCGGGSPLGPSGEGVTLRGVVVGADFLSGSAVSASSGAGAAEGEIIVTVEEDPSITTTVGADGTFTLRGLPEGSFTLVFTQDDVVLGTATFDEVLPNQEITITVEVADNGSVEVTEELRNGIGHGDVEIQGLVDEVVTVDPAGDSTFVIDGYTVIARPGETAIRKGNRRLSVEDVTAGSQVHVKGVWMEAVDGAQSVLAHEIKLQREEEEEEEEEETEGACMINGGKVGAGIQLEGRVASGDASGFMMDVNGNRAKNDVQIDSSGASFKCSGKTTDDECKAKVKAGQKIHVSGTLTSCDASSALVKASQVKPQGR